MSDSETSRKSENNDEFSIIEVVEEEVGSKVVMKTPERPTSLRSKLEELRKLERGQFDYVVARAHTDTIIDALREIGKSRSWYDSLQQIQRDLLETLSDDLHYEIALRAVFVLEAAALRAAEIKVSGLESADMKVRQRVATEILDRVVGKPDNNVVVNKKVTIGWDIPWKNG